MSSLFIFWALIHVINAVRDFAQLCFKDAKANNSVNFWGIIGLFPSLYQPTNTIFILGF
jgi:hypothetical protein